MKLIFVLVCIFICISCSSGVIKPRHSSHRKIEQTHEEFKNNTMMKINDINEALDSLQCVIKNNLIKDDRCPIIYNRQIYDYTIICIAYNNTTVLKDNFLGLSIDVLITTKKAVVANFTLTKEFFFEVFSDGVEELSDYDIRKICKLEVIQNNVEIDIMLCIPDTDLDYYFRVIISPNGALEITNVSDQYWDIEEN